MTKLDKELEIVLSKFESTSGLSGVDYELVKKPTGNVLVLRVSHPTERLFSILEEARASVVGPDEEAPLATLARKADGNLLDGPEGRLFLRTLSESQNVNRYSFEHDFMARYTKSVSGAESQIVSTANHVVLGRRGAGKSMLLLYAWHERRAFSMPSVWIDMQVYSGRDDDEVISDVLIEILEQTGELLKEVEFHRQLVGRLRASDISRDKIRRLLPDMRRLLGRFATSGQDLFVFIDDFHVLGKSLQPLLLDIIYAFSRGNRIFLKISAIETLTRTYDPNVNLGLEIPQDAQYIRLDYNLTTPDRAAAHIEAILNSHANYAGLRSVRRLCTSGNVIPRLTWVAAGVPRDALNLFSQAISKASTETRQKVSVSNVNMAASETLSTKLRELETDASDSAADLKVLLEHVRNFCVTEKRKNAFLVEIGADSKNYEQILNLVHLRLLHVISEGITIGEAGRKYLGLILDYGFYIGIRAAQSVDLFNRQTKRVVYKDLRVLPVFVA